MLPLQRALGQIYGSIYTEKQNDRLGTLTLPEARFVFMEPQGCKKPGTGTERCKLYSDSAEPIS